MPSIVRYGEPGDIYAISNFDPFSKAFVLSRGIVGGWHVTLFNWNAPGAPQVCVAGEPLVIDYADARARWAPPRGWAMPGLGA